MRVLDYIIERYNLKDISKPDVNVEEICAVIKILTNEKIASGLNVHTFYSEVECSICFGTERYFANNNCVNCTIERNDKNRVKARIEKKCLVCFKVQTDGNTLCLKCSRKSYKNNYLKTTKNICLKCSNSFGPTSRIYCEKHRKISLAYVKAYNKRVKHATPSWVDRQQLHAIFLNCPKGMSVDHIVPIRNKNVCGLNVPWNLQYLTKSENSQKGNRLQPL
jgi:hypothetical protein